jgi:hypothetical protein
MSEQATPAPLNCPFYGRHIGLLPSPGPTWLPVRILLLDSAGKQCALLTDRFAACELAVSGRSVEWRACPVIAAHTVCIPRP